MIHLATTPNPDIARMIAAGSPGAYIQHDAQSGQYHVYGHPLKPPLKKPHKPITAKIAPGKRAAGSGLIDKTIYIAASLLILNIAVTKCTKENTPSEPHSKPVTSLPTTRK